MPIRDVLFPMLSHPVATTADSVERAAALAAGLGAHIVGVTFELDIRSPVGLYAHPAGIGGMFAAETRKSASNARDLIAAFDDVCARQVAMRRGTMYEHLLEHCTPNVTVVDEKHLRKPHSGVELCKHLARHGVEVTFDKTPAEGRTIGEVLEGYAIERDIDLLVMGAYGHSRLREFILGGATKRVLTHPFTWTLVSH